MYAKRGRNNDILAIPNGCIVPDKRPIDEKSLRKAGNFLRPESAPRGFRNSCEIMKPGRINVKVIFANEVFQTVSGGERHKY